MDNKTYSLTSPRKWRKLLCISVSALASYAVVSGVQAQSAAEEVDYSDPSSWLCSPDNNAACEVSLDATVVAADATVQREPFMAKENAPVDCFYVYPTVSLDETPNSDLNPGDEELSVVKSQFARYGSQCRLFAPMYRQFTLTALRGGLSGGGTIDRNRGYNDVLNAWNYYMENHNDGRGVIFVGHSQGSGVLQRMIAAEIDGQPVEKQIISAHLIGIPVQVPNGEVVGASFKSMPLCEAADQTSCIVAYSAFRDTVPPTDGAMFGRGSETTQAACTNPAQLLRGSSQLHSYLSNPVAGESAPSPFAEGKVIDTPFVSVPGLLSGECKVDGQKSYLEITVNADPADPRTDTIEGDVMTADGPSTSWGLHLIDMHVAMGDLVGLAGAQIDAWLAK